MKFLSVALLSFLLVAFSNIAYCEEDEIVEEEGAPVAEVEEEETVEETLKPSPDAETTILFVKPSLKSSDNVELPAGKLVEFLVGFVNKADKDFVLETLDASFRYPMDYSFHIHNFSAWPYDDVVKPNQEATLLYQFIPAEAFGSRQFGLTINLLYRDLDGNSFMESVFNKTVPIVEIDEGLDGETFFLYVFLAAGIVLLLVLGQQALASLGKRRGPRGKNSSSSPEAGTKHDDVDYDWLPPETLQQEMRNSSRSPSPRQSGARQRRDKRTSGAAD